MEKFNVLICISKIVFVCSLIGCNSGQNNEELKMVEITNKGIISQFKATADESINLSQAAKHFEQYPERWNTAFKYLLESDLKKLPIGKVELSDDVFAIVSEYDTKNLEEAKFESHKKYIDLQYLVTGGEKIGLTNQNGIEVITPYTEEKDIMFYEFEGGDMLVATPGEYFIFFPTDKHKPCIDPEAGKGMVRKVVIKIKYS